MHKLFSRIIIMKRIMFFSKLHLDFFILQKRYWNEVWIQNIEKTHDGIHILTTWCFRGERES